MSVLTEIKIANLSQAKREIAVIGADPGGIALMAPKAVFLVLKLEKISPKAANILKQEMLSKGGEAAVAVGCPDCSIAETDVLLMGTVKQFREVVKKLKLQPWGLKEVGAMIEAVLKEKEA
jgi:dihydropteroate synthase